MSKTITLLDVYDLTDDVLDDGIITASLESIEAGIGQLALQKNFHVKDRDGQYSYFASNGALYKNSWRDADVVEKGDDDQRKYYGTINKLVHIINESGNSIKLDTLEPAGILMNFPIDESDLSTYAGFEVNGAHSDLTSKVVSIDTGATDIPVDSMVSFGDAINPRYQVIVSTGSPTTSITLDRPIEKVLANNATLRVAVATVKTGPGAIKDALLAAGFPSSLMGPSFDELDADDISNSYYIWMLVTQEKGVTLREHLSKLMDMTDTFITRSETGILNVFRGLAWDQISSPETITGNELMNVQIDPDFSKLIIGYECLYIESGGGVAIASGDSSAVLISEYAGKKLFQPIKAKSQLTVDYNYLYNSATSADYFGQRKLDFYSSPKWTMSSPVKSYFSGEPTNQLDISLGKTFNLDLIFGNGSSFEQEPVIIVGYAKDTNNEIYSNVKLLLNNLLQPGIIRSTSTIFSPSLSDVVRVDFDLDVDYVSSVSSDIIRYEFQMANDSSFTDYETYYDSGAGKSPSQTYTKRFKQVFTRKFFRCKAIDGSGNYSAWSNILDTDNFNTN